MILEMRSKDANRHILTIYVDEEPWADINIKIFGKNFILPSCATFEEWQTIFSSLEYAGARKYALDRLAQRSYPSGQLRKLLERNLVSHEICEKVLTDCKRMGFLNDDEWLELFVKGEVNRGVGPQMIQYKLRNKGVSANTVERVMTQFVSENDLLKAIRKLLNTKLKKFDITDFKQKQKVIASLARKGYPFDIIKSSLSD